MYYLVCIAERLSFQRSLILGFDYKASLIFLFHASVRGRQFTEFVKRHAVVCKHKHHVYYGSGDSSLFVDRLFLVAFYI